MNETISPQDLYFLLKSRKRNHILFDLRKPEEFEYWNIYGSLNVPPGASDKKLRLLNKNKFAILIPGDATHTKTVVSMIRKQGVTVKVLDDGMREWNKVYDVIKVPQDKKSKMSVIQFKRLGKGCLSYILVLPNGTHAVVIDPSLHISEYEKVLSEGNLKMIAVLDTHIHSDHVSGARLLSKKHHVPYLLPQKAKVKFRFSAIEEKLGKLLKEIPCKVLSTPGHTEESVSLFIDNTYLFTGDTLLVDIFGKPDIGEKVEQSQIQLLHSITSKLFELPESVFVFSAHANQSMVPGPLGGASMRYIKIIHKFQKSDYEANKQKKISPPPYIYIENLQIIKDINQASTFTSKASYATLEDGSNLYFYPDTQIIS